MLDSDGKEFARFFGSRKDAFFDKKLVAKIDAKLEEYRRSLTHVPEIAKYLATMVQQEKTEIKTFKNLVLQLESKQFATRESASKALLSIGEPAYQFLKNSRPSSIEAKTRVRMIVKKFAQWRQIIEQFQLERDVIYLAEFAETHPKIAQHLERIVSVPDGVEVSKWWKQHGKNYQWDADSRKYVQRTDESKK